MTVDYGHEVMDIFNYYVENSFAAFPENQLPYEFFGRFQEMTMNYPAYVVINGADQKVVGFCFLRAYSPFAVFRETAEPTYFLDKDQVGQGVGNACLARLEEEGRKMEIKSLVASISSENSASISFHSKNGFTERGRLNQIGKKLGKQFDVVIMQKDI